MSMRKRELDVVILCGGKGTRMHPLTQNNPKPMVKIGGIPVVEHIIRHYVFYGLTNFKLLTGHLGKVIHDYFKKKRIDRAKIECIDTGKESGTAERLWMVRDLVTSTFLWNYADDVGDVNIKEEMRFHQEKKKLLTMTVVPLRTSYGLVKINRENIATKYIEKPTIYQRWINAGFFIMEKGVFKTWNFSNSDFSRGMLTKLAQIGELACFKHQGFWSGVDTVRDYEILNELWRKNESAWAVWRK